MQMAVIEYARNVCGLAEANSSEVDERSPHPVIHLMQSQATVTRKGGTMRLGAYPCSLSEHSLAARLYGSARSASGTGTGTNSTTPTATSSPRPG
jgi:CTP synthase